MSVDAATIGGSTGREPAGRMAGIGLAAVAFVIAAAGLATALPLAAYTTALACFGLAHVASEMRYIALRFGRRIGLRLAVMLTVLLAAVVAARLSGIAGWLAPGTAVGGELMIAALLAACIIPLTGARPVAALTAGGLAAAAALWPFETLAVLAIAHNVTPLGFLAEALRSRARRRALAAGLVVFGLIPVLIASGLPQAWATQAGWLAPDASLFPVGPLEGQLGVYVPRRLVPEAWAANLFAAAVFAQLMHYAAVILVLPRLLPATSGQAAGGGQGMWRFLAGPVGFACVIAATVLISTTVFVLDFFDARAAYSLPAAVHAWIEIPVLLMALGGFPRDPRRRTDGQDSWMARPMASEAPLATSDSTSARTGDRTRTPA